MSWGFLVIGFEGLRVVGFWGVRVFWLDELNPKP